MELSDSPMPEKALSLNSLTNSKGAETGNYPFCTIEANKGRVFVPDERLKKISQIIQPQQSIPNSFEFTDIAGLVKGASQGEGLGNQFLSHIREADSLLHLVRAFQDPQITHVYGEPDPIRDIEIINTELLLSDLEMAEKRFQKIKKSAQSTGEKKLKEELEVLQKVLSLLNEGKSLRESEWTKEEEVFLKPLNFISLKPLLYVCNLKDTDFVKEKERWIPELQKKIGLKEKIICISCSLEEQMTGWTDQEKRELLKDLNLEEPVLHSVIKTVYEQLGLISFFTAGKKEVRAWTIPKASLAPSAGGVIHSDFEKGFIRAEVYSYKDLVELESEKAIQQKGLLKIVGKDYQVQDGDIMNFLFNVSK